MICAFMHIIYQLLYTCCHWSKVAVQSKITASANIKHNRYFYWTSDIKSIHSHGKGPSWITKDSVYYSRLSLIIEEHWSPAKFFRNLNVKESSLHVICNAHVLRFYFVGQKEAQDRTYSFHLMVCEIWTTYYVKLN